VATSHARVLLGQGHAAATALTGGFHWALWVCGLIALSAVLVTISTLRIRRMEVVYLDD